jgi:hypothetical protein
MKRRLLNLLTVLSLVLCAVVVALWVRSYWCTDAIKYSNGDSSWVFASGRVGLLASCYGDGMSKDWTGWHRWRGGPGEPAFGGVNPPPDRCGFAFQCFRWKANSPALRGVVLLPHWFVALPAAVLGAWRVRRHWSSGIVPGLCHACGYDLRATPGRCPECGTPAATPE